MFINDLSKSYLRFNWQEGFGAFTVGYRDLDRVFKYISNQQEHHLKKSFRDEYIQILVEEGIDYKPEFC